MRFNPRGNPAANPLLLSREARGRLTGPAGVVVAALVAAVAAVVGVGAVLALVVPLTLACPVPAGSRSSPTPFPPVAPGHRHPDVDGVVIWGGGVGGGCRVEKKL